MGTTLNDTPSAERTHIAFFGRMNSGKSSLINALAGQEISIVSQIGGTTTDLVKKPMEIYGIGPCILVDTAGFDDEGDLGSRRVAVTKRAAEQADLAVLVFSAEPVMDGVPWDRSAVEGIVKEGIVKEGSAIEGSVKDETAKEGGARDCAAKEGGARDCAAKDERAVGDDFAEEQLWYQLLQKRETPVILVLNKMDRSSDIEKLANEIEFRFDKKPLCVSARTGEGIEDLKKELVREAPGREAERFITGNLLQEEDVVLLVMPQDIQAPRGRLILPQVQTLRELLDKKCVTVCVTTDKMEQALSVLKQPPKLIITDSQVFKTVYEKKPAQSRLTSFSTLFAAYKGDIQYFVQGAQVIGTLDAGDKVLIAECCTHAPLDEDIGREKLPRLLRKKAGDGLTVEIVSGTDFPKDLSGYRLVIQCGACMFNRKYVMARVNAAKQQGIPMTNYGVAIAYINGILDQIETIC